MKKIIFTSILAAIIFTGCSAPAPKNDGSQASKTNQTAPAASKTASKPADKSKPYGSTFTWDNGVKITVTKPEPYKIANEYVKPQKADLTNIVSLNIAVENGDSKPLNPMMITIRSTTGDREAEAIFDSQGGIDQPTVDIQPGAKLSWKIAFAGLPDQPFVTQVNQGFGNAAGIYKD